jgi:formin-binding protein 1
MVQLGRDSGLVPASYVELLPPEISHSTRPASPYSNSDSASIAPSMGGGKKKGPAVAPKKGAKKLNYVTALYDYEARGDGEHSMQEGEKLVLVSGDAGDGWADVEVNGRVGSVPANYLDGL